MREAQVREVIAAYGKLGVDIDTVGVTDDLYARGLSSHASVNVMLGLEDAFDIEFPDRLLRKATFASIAAICAAVEDVTRDNAAAVS